VHVVAGEELVVVKDERLAERVPTFELDEEVADAQAVVAVRRRKVELSRIGLVESELFIQADAGPSSSLATLRDEDVASKVRPPIAPSQREMEVSQAALRGGRRRRRLRGLLRRPLLGQRREGANEASRDDPRRLLSGAIACA
jgi:hypothetical protein